MKILVLVGFVVDGFSDTSAGKFPISPSGSWVSGLINNLKCIDGFEVAVAMQAPVNKLLREEKGGVVCYYLPKKSRFSRFDVSDKVCRDVINDFEPDVMHAEGAELFIANRFFKNFNGKRVVSIKGVFNDVQNYEFAGLTFFDLVPKFVFYYAFLFWHKNIRFSKRRRLERETYRMADYALGRTIYDKSHALAFNEAIKYFHLGEDLRASFYQAERTACEVEEHSIFMSNGRIARKGAHIIVKALPYLLSSYPSCKLYLIVGRERFFDRFMYVGYLKNLSRRLGIQNNVVFLDNMTESEMASKLRNTHVYVVSSFVENSSNSLVEAMSIGTPCVVSYCGGVSSLAKDEDEVLYYRPDDYKMLAYQIRRVFSAGPNITCMTSKASFKARSMCDTQLNRERLQLFYRDWAAAN